MEINSYIIVFYILVTILALLGGAFQFKFSGHKNNDNDTSKKNKIDEKSQINSN